MLREVNLRCLPQLLTLGSLAAWRQLRLFIITFFFASSSAFSAVQFEPTQQDWRIYTLGVLEHLAFEMYNNQSPYLSDFVACVNREETKRLSGMLGTSEDVKEPRVFKVMDAIEMICGPYKGKGDGSKKPLHILKESDWKTYDFLKKGLYAMGYYDAGYYIIGKMNKDIHPKMSDQLKNCMDDIGIQGFMSQVHEEEKAFNWNNPLPWLISSAVAKACREYRP